MEFCRDAALGGSASDAVQARAVKAKMRKIQGRTGLSPQ